MAAGRSADGLWQVHWRENLGRARSASRTRLAQQPRLGAGQDEAGHVSGCERSSSATAASARSARGVGRLGARCAPAWNTNRPARPSAAGRRRVSPRPARPPPATSMAIASSSRKKRQRGLHAMQNPPALPGPSADRSRTPGSRRPPAASGCAASRWPPAPARPGVPAASAARCQKSIGCAFAMRRCSFKRSGFPPPPAARNPSRCKALRPPAAPTPRPLAGRPAASSRDAAGGCCGSGPAPSRRGKPPRRSSLSLSTRRTLP